MIEKKLQINEEGYSVRCRFFVADSNKSGRTFSDVVLVTHGFGSSKDTTGTTSFAEHLLGKYKKRAVLAFDWPCHGEDARKKLTVEECLKYLTIVVNYCKATLGAQNVYIYSTSMGGYLTLRYLLEVGNPFKKIALRCPALSIYDSMMGFVPAADHDALAKGKEILIGFDRKMKIDQGWFDSLKNFDVRQKEYFDYAEDILILHGTNDDTIPCQESINFADNNVIEFVPIEGANHPFQNPQHMALAISHVVNFFG